MQTTLAHSGQAKFLRLVNFVGNYLPIRRLPLASLNADTLLKKAEKVSGLSDWGDDAFLNPYRLLLESLNKEACPSTLGSYFFHKEILRLLVHRLQLIDELKKNPAISEVPVARPLIVIGMFRCGTSFLHNLLSKHPDSRWLRLAEALFPTPSPQQAEWDSDPRIAASEKITHLQNSLSFNFSTAHHVSPHKPAECSRLFEHDFLGHLFDFRARMPSYSRELDNYDWSKAYEFYRQQLQYLSYHWKGSHWVLKAPGHLFQLEALFRTFPDVCVVHLHRDPTVVVPSCCSLTALGHQRFSDKVDLKEIGQYRLEQLSGGVNSAMQARKTLPSEQIYDVQYRDLIADPLGTVRKIHEHFGYSMWDDAESQLSAWNKKNPQKKHGTHRYSLEQFDLQPKDIEERFGAYIKTYNIPSE